MKKMIQEKNAFWDVTNKGNALILALCVLNLISASAMYLAIQLAHLTSMKNEDTTLEVLKIKTIRRIKDEFYHQNCKDFTLEEGDCSVDVMYEDNQCTLQFYGKYSFQMKIQYDDVYLCISSVEYIDTP